MVFCSIEEAWQLETPRSNEYLARVGDSKPVPVTYPNSELYGSDGQPVRCAPKPSKSKPSSTKIQTAPTKKNPFHESKVAQPSQEEPSWKPFNDPDELDLTPYAPYLNRPINHEQTQEVYDAFEDMVSAPVQEPSPKMNLDVKQYVEIIRDLQSQNRKLQGLVEQLQSKTDKDSLFDLVVYLSSGLFVILMMENITSVSRRF